MISGSTTLNIMEKGFSSTRASWQFGAKEYHKVTLCNKPHTGDLLGGKKPRRVTGKKLQRTDQNTEFI